MHITIQHDEISTTRIAKVTTGGVSCDDCGNAGPGYEVCSEWAMGKVTAMGLVFETVAGYSYFQCKPCMTKTLTILTRVADYCYLGNCVVPGDHLAVIFHNSK